MTTRNSTCVTLENLDQAAVSAWNWLVTAQQLDIDDPGHQAAYLLAAECAVASAILEFNRERARLIAAGIKICAAGTLFSIQWL